jgi:hypothetical protein
MVPSGGLVDETQLRASCRVTDFFVKFSSDPEHRVFSGGTKSARKVPAASIAGEGKQHPPARVEDERNAPSGGGSPEMGRHHPAANPSDFPRFGCDPAKGPQS